MKDHFRKMSQKSQEILSLLNSRSNKHHTTSSVSSSTSIVRPKPTAFRELTGSAERGNSGGGHLGSPANDRGHVTVQKSADPRGHVNVQKSADLRGHVNVPKPADLRSHVNVQKSADRAPIKAIETAERHLKSAVVAKSLLPVKDDRDRRPEITNEIETERGNVSRR